MTHHACDCLQTFNARLVDHNTEISFTFGLGLGEDVRPMIAAKKIDTRKRVGPALVLPTFCPFCGNRYEPAPAPAAEGGAA